jgi:hypothetical protein
MKTKRIFLSVFILLTLNNCKTPNDNDVILNEYKNFDTLSNILYNSHQGMIDKITYNNNVTVFLEYNPQKGLEKIQSYLSNHMIGHYFSFKDNGKLKKYYYLLDSLTSCIEINFDSQKKITERGSPFIDNIENETEDTVNKYTLLFSQFPRKKLSVYISYNGVKYDTLKLTGSHWMPLLQEADIHTNNKTDIFLKIKASELLIGLDGLNDSRLIYDTIRF